MSSKEKKSLIIEDATLVFRNFSGVEGQFNKKGDKNFSVILDPATADAMAADGWNVKQLKGREEGEEGDFYIQVSVNFDNYPPRVVMITSTTRTLLNKDSIDALDWADILHVDLSINAYNWEVNGKTGVKAYLKSLYVTIDEDELDRKYAIQEDDE